MGAEGCVEGLPEFWAKIGAVLWPGYYQADADWMCSGQDFCQQEVRDISCDECFGGIQAGVDQLLLESTITGIVDALSGEDFCGAEGCLRILRFAAVIATLIPL